MSTKEDFLYFGIIKSIKSNSIFFIAIEKFISFLICCKYSENQDTLESLKYGGEKITIWLLSFFAKFIILFILILSIHIDGAVIDNTFIQISLLRL
jgi:hypothetical protein